MEPGHVLEWDRSMGPRTWEGSLRGQLDRGQGWTTAWVGPLAWSGGLGGDISFKVRFLHFQQIPKNNPFPTTFLLVFLLILRDKTVSVKRSYRLFHLITYRGVKQHFVFAMTGCWPLGEQKSCTGCWGLDPSTLYGHV